MSDISIVNASQVEHGQGAIPVGPLLISAVLEDHGYSTRFKDYQTFQAQKKLSFKTFYKFIQGTESVIGISAISSDLPTTLGAITQLKEEHPEKIVILGGPGPTDIPAEILEHFPVDIIVVGEGEETIVEVMQALDKKENLEGIEGIAYRDNDRIVISPRRKRIQNLDSLPFPAYDKIEFKDYNYLGGVMTIRGCPYRCTFCSAHSVWEREITQRTVENVIEELQILKEKRVRNMFIYDDTFVIDSQRVKRFAEQFHQESIDIPWTCYGRINLMTSELLEIMGKNGCKEILYGIESGSNNVLKRVNKKFTIEEASRIVEKTTQYTDVETSYIWGYPFETLEDFYDTLMVVFHQTHLPRVRPRLALLSPLPKSAIFLEYRAQIAFPDDPEIAHRLGFLLGREKLLEYPEVVALVKRHPGLFPSFYYFSHDLLEQKLELFKTMEQNLSRA
ncbi:MAG: B12-binding domain-containing radical SAM protein [Theionarchaea archaeon]|nr:B12-binding domain-containing radical SAM protein [Theionarchaea archaeon]MBU7020421.1 B12-binding domain-containing radical SAM protein [Theionarchaea archaeon]MBU7041636.1 B12-binding domain-containing radical SAM protein [Theionarchaea archaeon]